MSTRKILNIALLVLAVGVVLALRFYGEDIMDTLNIESTYGFAIFGLLILSPMIIREYLRRRR